MCPIGPRPPRPQMACALLLLLLRAYLLGRRPPRHEVHLPVQLLFCHARRCLLAEQLLSPLACISVGWVLHGTPARAAKYATSAHASGEQPLHPVSPARDLFDCWHLCIASCASHGFVAHPGPRPAPSRSSSGYMALGGTACRRKLSGWGAASKSALGPPGLRNRDLLLLAPEPVRAIGRGASKVAPPPGPRPRLAASVSNTGSASSGVVCALGWLLAPTSALSPKPSPAGRLGGGSWAVSAESLAADGAKPRRAGGMPPPKLASPAKLLPCGEVGNVLRVFNIFPEVAKASVLHTL